MTANRIVTTDSYNCKSISSSLQPLNPVWEVGKSKSGCCVSKKECILCLTCSLNPSYYDSWCYLLSWLRGLQITSLEQPEALDSENSQGRGHPPSIYSLRTSTESQPHLPWQELGKISSLAHSLSYCYNVVPPSAHVYRDWGNPPLGPRTQECSWQLQQCRYCNSKPCQKLEPCIKS